MQSSLYADDTAPSMRRGIRLWLFVLCALVFLMVIIGGITRLTDSGLSITEWQLLVGFLPPLNEEQWTLAFEKYKKIPEFNAVNIWMKLDDFKIIYWWEWGHRFLGRIIGLVFLLPFLFFLAMGQLRGRLLGKLLLMFLLGALQGGLGWYMVQSGLVDRVDVSAYRLAAHLSLAFAIFGLIFWVALSLRAEPVQNTVVMALGRPMVFSAAAMTVLLFLQVALGAFVAGIKAGKFYNSWPLIDDVFIPSSTDLFAKQPWFVNFFENVLLVQFNHRMLAYVIVIWAVIHALVLLRTVLGGPLKWSTLLLPGLIFLQVLFGIWTLLWIVPLPVAVLHQGMAVVVFAAAIFHLNLLAGEAKP